MNKVVITIALLLLAGLPAGAQTKVSKVFAVVVGHTVKIGWVASPSPGIDHYNVYSSATSGSGYVKIGQSAGLTYQDLTATSGNTYFYVVTAVNAAGEESPNSNEVKVTIPTP
jgi:fibronectin type 3 domain-containing protein